MCLSLLQGYNYRLLAAERGHLYFAEKGTFLLCTNNVYPGLDTSNLPYYTAQAEKAQEHKMNAKESDSSHKHIARPAGWNFNGVR
jgi:hypothetical protein